MARNTEQRKRSISVTIAPDVLDRLEKAAERMDIKPSISQLLERAAVEWLDRNEPRRK